MCKNPATKPEAGQTASVSPSEVSKDTASGDWVSPFSKWTEEDWKTRKFPTRAELKAVVPAHCFERSALTGFMYIGRDILFLYGGYALFFLYFGITSELPESIWGYPRYFLKWVLWGIAQGGLGGGLWVMGHECGHGAFSEYGWLNDLVGWVLHSLFLVPYFSWQFSHAKHHRRTNDMIEGETYVPETFQDTYCQVRYQMFKILGGTAYAFTDIFAHLLLYFPMYFSGLISVGRNGADGKPIEPGTMVDHYRPTSRMFPAKMRFKVILSDLGILIMSSILLHFALQYGFWNVFLWYGLPNIGMNCVYLVFVTWLQHTHPSIPHFGEGEWTWVKGALVGTVDRPHPTVDLFAHNIGSTHVCHHLFHEIPFYHAKEATAALKEYLEPKGMYNFDPTDLFVAMYKAARHCHYVETLDGIQYYKSFDQLSQADQAKKAA